MSSYGDSDKKEGMFVKRVLLVFVLLVAVTVTALALAGSAAAHGPCDDGGLPGNSDYGRLHIADHGPHGLGVGGHNPGTHQGYSLCLGVHS